VKRAFYRASRDLNPLNDRYTVQYTYFDEWIGLIDEFVDCIRNHKTPLINLKWHKETIQAMLGCYESIRTGKIARPGKGRCQLVNHQKIMHSWRG